MPSQVVLSRTLNKKQMLMSVATKIAIQLNCKMGGEVWAVEIPVISNIVHFSHYIFMMIAMHHIMLSDAHCTMNE